MNDESFRFRFDGASFTHEIGHETRESRETSTSDSRDAEVEFQTIGSRDSCAPISERHMFG
jgi:hypothetical protein